MNSSKKILMTGSTGFVGAHLARELVARGHHVTHVIRNPKKLEEKNLNGETIKYDLSQVKNPLKIEKKYDVVIHNAGIVHHFRPERFHAINTLGTMKLWEALKENPPEQFIFISSMAAAGPSIKDHPKSEKSKPRPVSAYGKSKLGAEKFLMKEAAPHTKLTIIRPPMVIGPEDPAFLDLFKMIQNVYLPIPGRRGKQAVYSFISVFDLVAGILKTIDQTRPGLFYLSHPKNITFEEFTKQIAHELAVPNIRYLSIPIPVLRFVALFLSFIYRWLPTEPRLTPDKVNELAELNWVCDDHKAKQELGFEAKYDIREIVQLTAKDYFERGWLP